MIQNEKIRTCAIFLLRPVVRFCLRHCLKLQNVNELLKRIFVEIAYEEIRASGIEPSASRISLMTGVHRTDVTRLLSEESSPRKTSDIITRVIGQWQQNNLFRSKKGTPLVLSCEGADSEFADLVSCVSRSVNPYTVLNELERIQAIRRKNGRVALVMRSYVPKGNLLEGFRLLGNDTEDLIKAVEENVLEEPTIPNLHIKTEYDYISPESAALIKEWFIKEGSAFHQRARNYLSQFDKDINPEVSVKGKPVRIAVGTFSRVEVGNENSKKVR